MTGHDYAASAGGERGRGGEGRKEEGKRRRGEEGTVRIYMYIKLRSSCK